MLVESDVDDLALIRDGHGDQAFEALYRRHRAQVLATCQRITGNHHDAEEAAQAVFLVLHNKARKALMVDSLPAWLHRVSCFVAMRLRDGRRRHTRREAGWDASPELAAPDTHPEGDRTGRLDEALDRLPAHYRLPLLLHYLECCPFDEIAARLQVRSDTIAVRVSRARALLRRHLGVSDQVVLGMGLASLPIPPAAGVASTPLPSASAAARRLADQYLTSHAATSVVTVLSMTGIAAIALGLVMACSSRPLAGPPMSASTPVVATAAAAAPATHSSEPVAYARASFPGPLWQERLVTTLNRQVSLHCGAQPLWSLIDAIGRQSDVVMLAASDLAAFQATVHPMALEQVSLQALLDQLATEAGLQYQLYAGGLFWQRAGSPPPARAVVPGVFASPTIVLRWYRQADLPPGRSLQAWIVVVSNRPELHFDQPHTSIEEAGSVLVIGQRADAEASLDAILQPAPIARPASAPPAPAGLIPALRPAEMAVQRACEHAIGQELPARATLGAMLADLAAQSGVVLTSGSDALQLLQAPPARALPLRVRGLPLRFALCQLLEGSGLQAALDLPAAGQDQRPVLHVGPTVAPHVACHSYHFSMTTPSGRAALFDGEGIIDWLRVNVDEPSWTDDQATARVLPDGTIRMTQSLEVLDDLDQAAPRLQTLEQEQPLPPRVPLLPPLTITIAHEPVPELRDMSLMSAIGCLTSKP